MTELSELYQQVILDHNDRPQNFRELAGANRTAEGFNPLCGDRVTVYLQMDDEVITEIGFLGSGCAISKSSASMMTASVKGKTKAEAEVIFKMFHGLVTGAPDAPVNPEALGKLAVFSGVREFPTRVKCAILAWYALHAALDENRETVSTEEGGRHET